MRDAAIAVWVLGLWPVLVSADPIAVGLALAGMVLGALGASMKGKVRK